MMYAIDPTMSFAQVVQYYKDYVKRTNRQILKSDDPVAKKPPAHPIFLFIPQKSHPTSDAFAAKQMWGFYFPDKSKFI